LEEHDKLQVLTPLRQQYSLIPCWKNMTNCRY